MKNYAKILSKSEMKKISGGLLEHYYCLCPDGSTMNGSASSQQQAEETAARVCGYPDQGIQCIVRA